MPEPKQAPQRDVVADLLYGNGTAARLKAHASAIAARRGQP